MKTCVLISISIILCATDMHGQGPLTENCNWEIYVGLTVEGNDYDVSATNVGEAMWGSDFNLTESVLGTPFFPVCYTSVFVTPGINWPYGFDFINSINSSGNDCVRLNDERYLPYGLFKITYQVRPPEFRNSETLDEASIFLDLRDDRYCHTGLNSDMWVRYNETNSNFEFEYYSSNDTFDPGDTIHIWDYDPPHSTGTFQPTNPSSLSLTNYNGHPKLTWSGSEPSESTKYNVYRNNGRITDPAISQTNFSDEDVTISSSGFNFDYKIRAVSGDGSKYSANYSNTVSTHGYSDKIQIRSMNAERITAGLECSYPNPSNPVATINYGMPGEGHVSIIIYDSIGREVKRLVDEPRPAGRHTATFETRGVSSGLYFCRMVATISGHHNVFTSVTKIMILK